MIDDSIFEEKGTWQKCTSPEVNGDATCAFCMDEDCATHGKSGCDCDHIERHTLRRLKTIISFAPILAAALLSSCAEDRTTGRKYPISPFAAIVPGDYGY